MTQIVLASSSPYRRMLLSKTGLSFTYQSPDIDETQRPNETAEQLVKRLSVEKAQALATNYADSYIIGSDQVLSLDETILSKPLTHENAVKQLLKCSGKSARLKTGVAIIHPNKQIQYVDIDTYEIQYRTMSLTQIEKYLLREKPYDCCGSLKAEGPGIRLLKELKGSDPNTLIGLPVIKIIDFFTHYEPELLNNY